MSITSTTMTPPDTCDEEGHEWNQSGPPAPDGTAFWKCRRCGEEVEV